MVGQLRDMKKDTQTLQISSLEEIPTPKSQQYPYLKRFGEAQNDPVVILLSSGSTGIPCHNI